jgi:hypothetical protein
LARAQSSEFNEIFHSTIGARLSLQFFDRHADSDVFFFAWSSIKWAGLVSIVKCSFWHVLVLALTAARESRQVKVVSLTADPIAHEISMRSRIGKSTIIVHGASSLANSYF